MRRAPMTRERAAAVALCEQGFEAAEIARRLGLSRGTVYALLRRPATFAERACELCGEPFTPTNGRQRYCSVEHHRQANARPPKPRECRLCGQLFFATERCGQRYCTPEHRREHARRQRAVAVANGSSSSAAEELIGSVSGWRERVRRLEAQVAQARAELAGREAA
jgi:AcrR family transcriptional regulator